MQECCTHDQPLLHSVRKTLDELVFPSSELEQLEHLAHAIATRWTIESVQSSMKPQEFTRGQLLVEEWTIGNESERRLRALRVRLQIVAVDENPSGGRLQQSRDHADRRRLAGAVRAEKDDDDPH